MTLGLFGYGGSAASGGEFKLWKISVLHEKLEKLENTREVKNFLGPNSIEHRQIVVSLIKFTEKISS